MRSSRTCPSSRMSPTAPPCRGSRSAKPRRWQWRSCASSALRGSRNAPRPSCRAASSSASRSLAVSDRIIVMSNARIAQVGTPRELYEEPANLFVADFIGDANILTGTITEVRGASARVALDALTLALPSRGVPPGPVKLAIRPDAMRLATQSPPGPAIQGRISKASYLGTHVEYEIGSAVGELFVVEHGRREPAPVGSDVWIQFADRGVSIVPDERAA